jgi:hypothetical protein
MSSTPHTRFFATKVSLRSVGSRICYDMALELFTRKLGKAIGAATASTKTAINAAAGSRPSRPDPLRVAELHSASRLPVSTPGRASGRTCLVTMRMNQALVGTIAATRSSTRSLTPPYGRLSLACCVSDSNGDIDRWSPWQRYRLIDTPLETARCTQPDSLALSAEDSRADLDASPRDLRTTHPPRRLMTGL